MLVLRNLFVPFAYLTCGLVNLAPTVGVSSNTALEGLYAVKISNADLLLLMRHRAILFGIVGCLLLLAVVRRDARTVAGMAGLASMVSYLFLYVTSPVQNSQLLRIAWIDGVACVLLLIAFALHVMGNDDSIQPASGTS